MDSAGAARVEEAARAAAFGVDVPLVLAVSGGADSMALLLAMVRAARERVAVVATFDHGTGPAAMAAAAHVARCAGALGVRVVVGRQPSGGRAPNGWEAAWREARHGFLRDVARLHGARVAVAHTEDDQLETVLLRLMRGSGTRGLAGLEAPSDIVRPFVRLPRALLVRYVEGAAVEWIEDPGNSSTAHARNRLRRDVLPALRRADPTLAAALLRTGRTAASWRRELDRLVRERMTIGAVAGGGVTVPRAELAGHGADSLAVLWGAIAGGAGLSLDRRGTERLTSFIMKGATRGEMPLSGGWRLEARRDAYRLVRAATPEPALVLPEAGMAEWGAFRFRVGEPATREAGPGAWSAWIANGGAVRVRSWGAGDRLADSAGHSARRVARYLSDAGLHGAERAGWPVVVTGSGKREHIVWIPGVRRSGAASERSGRPVRHYACERIGR